jgi:hypothetical protein
MYFSWKQLRIHLIYPGRELCRLLTGQAGNRSVSLQQTVQSSSGVHPTCCSEGSACSVCGVKRTEREADGSPSSAAELVNACSSNLLALYIRMAVTETVFPSTWWCALWVYKADCCAQLHCFPPSPQVLPFVSLPAQISRFQRLFAH